MPVFKGMVTNWERGSFGYHLEHPDVYKDLCKAMEPFCF